jgi:hypothetical protein
MQRFLARALVVVALSGVVATPAFAFAATPVTLTVVSGGLWVSVPPGATVSGAGSTSGCSATIGGRLGLITVTDQRAGMTTWTASVSSSAVRTANRPPALGPSIGFAARRIRTSSSVSVAVCGATGVTGDARISYGAPGQGRSASSDPTISSVVPAGDAPGGYSVKVTHSVL